MTHEDAHSDTEQEANMEGEVDMRALREATEGSCSTDSRGTTAIY